MYSRWNGRPGELNKIIIWRVTFWNFKPLNFYSKHTFIEILNRKEEKKLTVIRQNETVWKNRKHKTLEAYIILRLGSSFYPVINNFPDWKIWYLFFFFPIDLFICFLSMYLIIYFRNATRWLQFICRVTHHPGRLICKSIFQSLMVKYQFIHTQLLSNSNWIWYI